MGNTRVGIVEDEIIIALSISQTLTELGYDVTEPAQNYTEALEMIRREVPDLLLLDIQLGGSKDGIHVAEVVRAEYNIPIIFLTANADLATVERAKNVRPDAYLVKPYRKNELFAAVELSISNFGRKSGQPLQQAQDSYLVKDAIFIKQGQYFHKVKIDDILYLESDNIYVNVYTVKSKMLVRSTLPDYLDLLNAKQFYRVHRSYAVNTNHIQTINSELLLINNVEIPISKAYRDNLLGHLKLG